MFVYRTQMYKHTGILWGLCNVEFMDAADVNEVTNYLPAIAKPLWIIRNLQNAVFWCQYQSQPVSVVNETTGLFVVNINWYVADAVNVERVWLEFLTHFD